MFKLPLDLLALFFSAGKWLFQAIERRRTERMRRLRPDMVRCRNCGLVRIAYKNALNKCPNCGARDWELIVN